MLLFVFLLIDFHKVPYNRCFSKCNAHAKQGCRSWKAL